MKRPKRKKYYEPQYANELEKYSDQQDHNLKTLLDLLTDTFDHVDKVHEEFKLLRNVWKIRQ